MELTQTTTPCTAVGWMFVSPSAIPAGWQARAVPVAMIPLLAHELAGMLTPTVDRGPSPSPDDVLLMSLVARGTAKKNMARELHVSVRTVDRRLHALRQQFGGSTLPELAVILARQGFGER